MREETFLVAVVVEVEDDVTRAEAEKGLYAHLPVAGKEVWSAGPYKAGTNPRLLGSVECWWVAEDDRQDRADNDSAIFVPYCPKTVPYYPKADCLIVFPANTDLEAVCARCRGYAGDHPAPANLLSDPEAPVTDRPTLREARGVS